MANKHRGYVEIELDKPRRLRFDTNALAELEDALGRPVTKIDQNNVGIREIRAMLWAGLLHEDPKLTLRQAGDLMSPDNLQEVSTKVVEAIQLAFGTGSKNNESGPNGTGQE